jgi:hypothetical protein
MTSEVVRYEIKNFITWTLTWKYWLEKSGYVRLSEHEHNKLILVLRERLDRFLVDPVDDEDWKRSSTNWSFFSKWFWNWFQLDFRVETPCVQLWFSVSARSIDQDSFWFRSGIVSSIVSSLVSRLVHSTWT